MIHVLDGNRRRGYGTMLVGACMDHWKGLIHALGPIGDRMVVRGR